MSSDGQEERAAVSAKLDQLAAEAESAGFVRASKIERQIAVLAFALDNQCRNPREIPLSDLKAIVQAPVVGDDTVTNQLRSKVRSRATAIRAKCASCMGGGGFTDILNCPSVTCPLYPFRLGKDPLRGFELPVPDTIDCSDEDDEDADLFSSGDDGDDTDAKE
ncbi:hypothetical protein RCKICKAPOO_30 [Rhodobacter phage RcKickapoo]|nr:hypothetical protein RCTIPTONUS_27 [Rhodobacter phage RcTiptonus]UUV43771.1 hypothetical protein RCKICKAPOO_30 [Rhodobacter phage RcKickapoo]UUV44398.1 hypothetical protein RCMENCHIE_29 [Rhodobacter phage RcMenchie]